MQHNLKIKNFKKEKYSLYYVGNKKCHICGKEAKYCIRGTNDCYCEECAREFFGDLDLLEKIDKAEHQAKEIKKIADMLISARGVKHGKLVTSTTGKHLV